MTSVSTPDASSGAGGFVSVMGFDWMLVSRGTDVDVQLPVDTFVHSDSRTTLRWVAESPSGQALPPWLQFDADRHRLIGTPPAGLRSLVVRLTAHDAKGAYSTTLLPLLFTP